MKLVHKMIDQIDEELEGALDYAEKFIESKVHGDTNRANVYRQMSYDELTHAGNVYEFSTKDIEKIRNIHHMSEVYGEYDAYLRDFAKFVDEVEYDDINS